MVVILVVFERRSYYDQISINHNGNYHYADGTMKNVPADVKRAIAPVVNGQAILIS